MIVIVDCGATKAVWCGLDNGRREEFLTPGINFAHTSAAEMDAELNLGARSFQGAVEQVWFYGAGLVSDRMIQDLQLRLRRCFPGAAIECASDMVGAARAACGRQAGIAAILGTGANTCQWDGRQITRKVNCGGYIVGDEGSASVLGKLFVTDYLKDFVPEGMAQAFARQFPADYPTLVRNIYAGEAPARYLGGFAPFILSFYEREAYAKELVDNNFRAFFERTVKQYDALPLGVVGGFGHACRDILSAVGREYGIAITSVLRSPMDGLVQYHGL